MNIPVSERTSALIYCKNCGKYKVEHMNLEFHVIHTEFGKEFMCDNCKKRTDMLMAKHAKMDAM